MTLPETHVGELFGSALPDLVQAVRAPDHPDAEGLVRRAREEIEGGYALADALESDETLRAWNEAEAEGVFRTLLAVAHLFVARGINP